MYDSCSIRRCTSFKDNTSSEVRNIVRVQKTNGGLVIQLVLAIRPNLPILAPA